ncbi:hypothetical protein RFI_20452, partial [Reticulomyxa filosa]
ICTHPLCWKQLTLKVEKINDVPTPLINRSFRYLRTFELDWSNPRMSICGLNHRSKYSLPTTHGNNATMIIDDILNMNEKQKIEKFFKHLSTISNKYLRSFKLKPGGGPFRLANSSAAFIKFEETHALLQLILKYFSNLRKFKMDVYNIISLQKFIHNFTLFRPQQLEFLELQVLIFDTNTQRPNPHSPVTLPPFILPSSLRHLSLPLLADDSWITQQYLPNLEFLFFFGFNRSSTFALHENRLTIASLNHIAGVKSNISQNVSNTVTLLVPPNTRGNGINNFKIKPSCPKIKCIEIALRETDYMAILLRPVIRKLFQVCSELEYVKLGTAGDLELAHGLFKSLVSSNLNVCSVQAKVGGRPEKPIGFVEFRKIFYQTKSGKNEYQYYEHSFTLFILYKIYMYI